jgi:hypothetical protein
MKTSSKALYWTARIICIIAILLISLFSLDSFSPDRTFWQNITAFLMHNIPSFILLAALIIAWKWEKVGGIILTIIGLAFSIFIFVFNYKRNQFPIMTCLMQTFVVATPFVLAGILFILSHYRRKNEFSSAH